MKANAVMIYRCTWSVIALTDEYGNVVARYNYGPWGETDIVHDDDGTGAANPIRYTGREMDETGLYYYRARYYAPEMGRFISEDPIGFAGGDVNWNSYVGNNPCTFSDPLGLWGPGQPPLTSYPDPGHERSPFTPAYQDPPKWPAQLMCIIAKHGLEFAVGRIVPMALDIIEPVIGPFLLPPKPADACELPPEPVQCPAGK